jgi:NTE family protein
MSDPPPIPEDAKPKRALVISGGGSKGQYAVGAVSHLLGELEMDFDIYAGVSVGALIAAFLAQYPSGQERQASEDLQKLFTPIRNRDIWRNWFLGYLAGALWKPSLRDSSPLEKLIGKKLDPEKVRSSGKELRFGAVSLDSGKYQLFDQDYVPLAPAVYSSAAYPAMFKPGRHHNQWWTDGGVRTVTPLKAAIDAGASHIVYITLAPEDPPYGFETKPESIDVAFRSLELMSDQITRDDIKIAQMYNSLVEVGARPDKRKVSLTAIRPSGPINSDSLNFDPVEAEQVQLRGYRDTIEALSAS